MKGDGIYLFFALNYFAQGMSGLVYEPISYVLKDALGLSAGQSAVFIGWMTFPFLMKPLFGFVTDLFPLGGYRRRPHIMIVSGVAAAAWLALAALGRYEYGPLLALLILVNAGIVASDVVCDGVMVEQGKESRKTGLYQAVQIGTLYLSLVVTGIGGGWLAAHLAPRRIFALTALFPLLIFFSAFWVREPKLADSRREGLKALRGLLRERRFWFLSLFIFLWSFYPFLGTAQFYYQSEVLKLSPVFIGSLSTLAGIAGVLGAAFYARLIGKVFQTPQMVRAAVILGFPLSLLYLFYLGPMSVVLVTVLTGFGGVAFRLALMDLAAQSCPGWAEATAFAVYMSVFNLAAWASNTAGGRLYDFLQARFAGQPTPAYLALAVLTLIGSLCTLSCWWLVPHVAANGES